jgi:hypothetical protein
MIYLSLFNYLLAPDSICSQAPLGTTAAIEENHSGDEYLFCALGAPGARPRFDEKY